MNLTEVWGHNVLILMKYIDESGVPVVFLDKEKRVIYCNRLFLVLIKASSIPVGRAIADFLSPQAKIGFSLEFEGDYKQAYWTLKGGNAFYRSLCHIYKTTEQFIVFIEKPLLTDDSFLKEFSIINSELSLLMRELHKKNAMIKEANEALKAKEVALNQAAKIANMGYWIWYLASNELILSESVYHLWEKKVDETVDKWSLFFEMIHLDDRERIRRVLAEIRQEPKACDCEFRFLHKDEADRYCRIIGQVDWGEDGSSIRILGVLQDITQNKLYEKNIRKLAFCDTLTGLPNRRLFEERLTLALANGKRYGETIAVLFIDLDGFKKINDTLGHEAGDTVLQHIGRQLKACIRNCDTAARLGGDEFIIILQNCNLVKDTLQIAERIIAVCSKPISIKDQVAVIGASIGISFFPKDGDESEELIKKADEAMYQSKQLGGNCITIFQSS